MIKVVLLSTMYKLDLKINSNILKEKMSIKKISELDGKMTLEIRPLAYPPIHATLSQWT